MTCSRSQMRHWGMPCLTNKPQGLRGLGSPWQEGQFSVSHTILEERSLFIESLSVPGPMATKVTTRMAVPLDRWT